MRRRAFIALLAGVAAVPSFAARAETMRRVGILFTTSAQGAKARGLLEAVTQGLKESGLIEGQDFTFVSRFADGKEDALPRLAAELAQMRVDAIVTDGTPAAQAAKNVSRTVPIVALTNDTVASGLAASLNRPGGNITGISLLSAELAGRRLQLLSELVPNLARVAVLSNPANPSHAVLLNQTRAAAQSLKVELHVAEAPTPDRLDSAFATIEAAHAGALIVFPDAVFFGQYPRVVAFAATAHLPALFPERQVVQAGGLMAYGPRILAAFQGLGVYAGKILRGASPADLPIEAPTTFELTINLKTAKALGLTVPDKLISTADEVIE
jgi:putative ABC transport system substrate-binding protein